VALWSLFVFRAVVVESVTVLGVLDLVLRSWLGVFSWLGVCGADCSCAGVVQSGVSVGGAQSLRSSVTIFLNICCLSWLTSFLNWSVGSVCVVSDVIGRVTPTVVNALQHGHCLAWRWGRWCMWRLPKLAPSASRRVAALVASILSIERDVSMARPAMSRACVCLESALKSVEFSSFACCSSSSSSSSSCIASGLFGAVMGGCLFSGFLCSK